ncbi:hypothetical protein CCHR01_16479 [Colletotrichum chrysophilum]|uniref:Uncharacterized protein n=1 Tax=Colletotrichum chrysophilum TaxID=1836956 RepID=A0AAD9A4C5_9PEZI|nr:hypothetical protein CCHR01_16479 [Colletotrichum chrysophilum]
MEGQRGEGHPQQPGLGDGDSEVRLLMQGRASQTGDSGRRFGPTPVPLGHLETSPPVPYAQHRLESRLSSRAVIFHPRANLQTRGLSVLNYSNRDPCVGH